LSSSKIQSSGTPTSSSGTQSEIEGIYKVFTRSINLDTSQRVQLLDITDRVSDVILKSQVKQGHVHVQTLHTTTSLFINEWQDALLHDLLQAMETIVPRQQYWRHNDANYSDCDRHNADSHLRGMLLGSSLSLQVINSSLHLGIWQRIIFAEFDGPRVRTISVQIAGIKC
jgi:secondary thiamine-phosphate synthase enzyme